MRRNLERLANERFDLLIIGGGITGACVARDAARRGLRVALIEKGDFASATSAHNSKLIHGGLRYLRNFELGLVRESLRERRIWQRIAPHLVRPLPFLLPVPEGWQARATLSAGLTLYDVLSFDRTWLDDPDQRLPGHSWLDRKAAIAREPVMDQPHLGGALLYYDAQMYSPERLALECLIDADAQGAAIANYVEAKSLLIRDGKVEGAQARDCVDNGEFSIQAKATLLAAGPWADIFLDRALSKQTSHRLMRSKGIHLVVPKMTRETAITVAAKEGHFFLLPWREHTIIGTTDTSFPGAPDSVGVSEHDIASFLDFVNEYLPAAHLKRSDVEHFYAGLRPLVDDGTGDSYDASRRAELIDHGKDDGVTNLFSAIGGKWTTSRALAQSVVDAIEPRLDAATKPSETANAILPGGKIGHIKEFLTTQSHAHPELQNVDHLTRMYGARLNAMLDEAGNRPDLSLALSDTGDIGAQILFAIREEMALTLDDVVTRRTGLGQLGAPTPAVLSRAADIMSAELGWSAERRAREIETVSHSFATRGDQ